jgi:hypothetical protein
MSPFEADRHSLSPPSLHGLEGETIPQIASNENLRQNPSSSMLGLSLVARGLVEVIGFHGACQLAMPLRGHSGIAQPPAPSRARADMDPQFSRDAPRRTGETQQKGGEDPIRQRARAPMQQGRGEVVEGALTAMALVPLALGSIVVRAPQAHVVVLAARTWEQTILPPEHTDVGLALFSVEEVVDMGKHRHDGFFVDIHAHEECARLRHG